MALARIMAVDRAEEAAAEHKKPAAQPPSPWDCGTPLYDAFELASVHRVLDTHLMALPFARRPCDADDAAAVLAVGVAKRATARSRRRRRSAVGVAKLDFHCHRFLFLSDSFRFQFVVLTACAIIYLYKLSANSDENTS